METINHLMPAHMIQYTFIRRRVFTHVRIAICVTPRHPKNKAAPSLGPFSAPTFGPPNLGPSVMRTAGDVSQMSGEEQTGK